MGGFAVEIFLDAKKLTWGLLSIGTNPTFRKGGEGQADEVNNIWF
jgi:hypothetical protein